MLLIGCDFHRRFQQIAMLDSATGEIRERRWEHPEEAQMFYAGRTGPARVGMEATGHAQWFERMLREWGHEPWVGDTAEIRARAVRKQKTDLRNARRNDAQADARSHHNHVVFLVLPCGLYEH